MGVFSGNQIQQQQSQSRVERYPEQSRYRQPSTFQAAHRDNRGKYATCGNLHAKARDGESVPPRTSSQNNPPRTSQLLGLSMGNTHQPKIETLDSGTATDAGTKQASPRGLWPTLTNSSQIQRDRRWKAS